MDTDPRIDEIEVDGGEYFVWLKKGYRLNLDFSQDGRVVQHCFGAVTREEIDTQMEDVVPCTCDWCLGKL